MHVFGHRTHAAGLGIVFVWFGMLKVFGEETATGLVAKTIYWQLVDGAGAWGLGDRDWCDDCVPSDASRALLLALRLRYGVRGLC